MRPCALFSTAWGAFLLASRCAKSPALSAVARSRDVGANIQLGDIAAHTDTALSMEPWMTKETRYPFVAHVGFVARTSMSQLDQGTELCATNAGRRCRKRGPLSGMSLRDTR